MIEKKREIKIVEITGSTVTQIETSYNTNFAKKGWRIIQIFEIGTKRYVLAEREI